VGEDFLELGLRTHLRLDHHRTRSAAQPRLPLGSRQIPRTWPDSLSGGREARWVGRLGGTSFQLNTRSMHMSSLHLTTDRQKTRTMFAVVSIVYVVVINIRDLLSLLYSSCMILKMHCLALLCRLNVINYY